jgi:hypothetical protein
MFNFNSTIYKEGMNYVVDVPDDSKSYFQKDGYIPVKGTIDTEKFIGTLIPRKGNKYALFIKWEIRTKINKTEFDEVEVKIEYDPESRELPVPEDVELILAENSEIYNAFLKLSTSHRRELIQYVTNAKKDDTRLKRIQKIEDHLRERIFKKK